ncbi:MAG: diguanylate cyclase [Eubacterium sp.]|nr:diguanylate cyclase [Eubacterium sp.]
MEKEKELVEKKKKKKYKRPLARSLFFMSLIFVLLTSVVMGVISFIILRNDDDIMKKYFIIVSGVTVALLLLCVSVMTIWIKKRVINPLKRIEESAKKFDTIASEIKDANALILDMPELGSGDELESLSNTLSSMSYSMKNYVGELLLSATSDTDGDDNSRKTELLGEFAIKDKLTGIRNKLGYDREVKKTIWELENGIKNFGVVLVDLNSLSHINEEYGNESGDEAIIKLCHLVCVVFSHSPVFRIDGNKFAVILKGSDYDESEALVDKFNSEIESVSADESLKNWQRISAAIGYAIYDERKDLSYDDVYKRADKEMYKRKSKMKE